MALKQRKEKRRKINRENKQRIKNNKDGKYLESYILSKIKKYWSPEQISGRLREEEGIILSKDTIYTYLYREQRELVKKYLRRKGKKYQRNRKEKYQLMDRKMIEERDEKYREEIENKTVI